MLEGPVDETFIVSLPHAAVALENEVTDAPSSAIIYQQTGCVAGAYCTLCRLQQEVSGAAERVMR